MKAQKIYPIRKNNRFYNAHDERSHSVIFPSLAMYGKSFFGRVFDRSMKVPFYDQVQLPNRSVEPKVTWLGHATFLIQIAGMNIITDPIFSDMSWLFPRAAFGTFIPNQLPPIDVVLLSHNHYDHMDAKSLQMLTTKKIPVIFLPEGLGNWFNSAPYKSVKEFMWWDYYKFHSGIQVTFLPAWHWSQRTLFDRNKSLWGSWLIKYNEWSCYFAGDTAYSKHFTSIADNVDSISVALLPIGPAEPRDHMQHAHMGPEQAVQAVHDLQPNVVVPMHWGTYYFGTDRMYSSLDTLVALWGQENACLYAMPVGKTIQF